MKIEDSASRKTFMNTDRVKTRKTYVDRQSQAETDMSRQTEQSRERNA
jgi:hypothetical protein